VSVDCPISRLNHRFFPHLCCLNHSFFGVTNPQHI
jgi:predicted ArsR family transcriptional regulator